MDLSNHLNEVYSKEEFVYIMSTLPKLSDKVNFLIGKVIVFDSQKYDKGYNIIGMLSNRNIGLYLIGCLVANEDKSYEDVLTFENYIIEKENSIICKLNKVDNINIALSRIEVGDIFEYAKYYVGINKFRRIIYGYNKGIINEMNRRNMSFNDSFIKLGDGLNYFKA